MHPYHEIFCEYVKNNFSSSIYAIDDMHNPEDIVMGEGLSSDIRKRVESLSLIWSTQKEYDAVPLRAFDIFSDGEGIRFKYNFGRHSRIEDVLNFRQKLSKAMFQDGHIFETDANYLLSLIEVSGIADQDALKERLAFEKDFGFSSYISKELPGGKVIEYDAARYISEQDYKRRTGILDRLRG